MFKSIVRSLQNRFPLVRATRINIEMLPALLMGRRRRAARRWPQHGEDECLVRDLRGSLRDGYYVDVGANHPAEISNAHRLYNLGMCGVTVEPNELLCAIHRRYRPRDSVVNTAVGGQNGFARFFQMSHHAFSTFSEADERSREAAGLKLLGVTFKPVFRLETIHEQCVPPGRTKLELLSVDTEKWDEVVVRSNDWKNSARASCSSSPTPPAPPARSARSCRRSATVRSNVRDQRPVPGRPPPIAAAICIGRRHPYINRLERPREA